ncbi:hypothetical protein PSI23_22025, partial [Xenorhabdus sp. XENO-10]
FTLVRLATTASIPGATMSLPPPGRSSAYRAITAVVLDWYIGSKNNNYPESVRKKYASSWDMYCKHYPHLTKQLLLSENDVTSIAPDVEWKEVFDRYPEDYSYAIETKITY